MILKKNERAALCLWCGKMVKVGKDNLVRSHKAAGGGKCEGSNKRVEAEISEK